MRLVSPPLNEEVVGPPSRVCAFIYIISIFIYIISIFEFFMQWSKKISLAKQNAIRRRVFLSIQIIEQRNHSKMKVR